MSTIRTASFAALIGAAAILKANASPIGYSYDWSGGGSFMVLDASSSPSGGGAFSEILEADLLGVWIYGFEEPTTANPDFTWNPTEITDIDLEFPDGSELDAGKYYPVIGFAQTTELGNIHPEGEFNILLTGSWLADGPVSSLPDAASTGLLFAGGLAGLGLLGLGRKRIA